MECHSYYNLLTSPIFPVVNTPEINISAVIGATNIGIKAKGLGDLLATSGSFSLTQKNFLSIQGQLGCLMEQEIAKNIEENIKMELDSSSIEMKEKKAIAAYCDGNWSKRSFTNNYSSKSGCGIIIGFQTKKIIFLGGKINTVKCAKDIQILNINAI